MKKTKLLNRDISHMIADLGHTDIIVIADSGFPVPPGVRKIDLALTEGVPGFLETVRVVLSELCIEKLWVADEMAARSAHVRERLLELVGDAAVESLPHEDFKAMTAKRALAVIRTGECTPYCNVMLQAGVVF